MTELLPPSLRERPATMWRKLTLATCSHELVLWSLTKVPEFPFWHILNKIFKMTTYPSYNANNILIMLLRSEAVRKPFFHVSDIIDTQNPQRHFEK